MLGCFTSMTLCLSKAYSCGSSWYLFFGPKSSNKQTKIYILRRINLKVTYTNVIEVWCIQFSWSWDWFKYWSTLPFFSKMEMPKPQRDGEHDLQPHNSFSNSDSRICLIFFLLLCFLCQHLFISQKLPSLGLCLVSSEYMESFSFCWFLYMDRSIGIYLHKLL